MSYIPGGELEIRMEKAWGQWEKEVGICNTFNNIVKKKHRKTNQKNKLGPVS